MSSPQMGAHRRAVEEKCPCPCSWCGERFKSKMKLKNIINDNRPDPVTRLEARTGTVNPEAPVANLPVTRSREPPQQQPILRRWKLDCELEKSQRDNCPVVLALFHGAYYRLAYPQAPLEPMLQRSLRPAWLPLWVHPEQDTDYFRGGGTDLFAQPHHHDPLVALQAVSKMGAVIIGDPDDVELLRAYDPRLEPVQTASPSKHQQTFVNHTRQEGQQPYHGRPAGWARVNEVLPRPAVRSRPYATREAKQTTPRDRDRSPRGARGGRDPSSPLFIKGRRKPAPLKLACDRSQESYFYSDEVLEDVLSPLLQPFASPTNSTSGDWSGEEDTQSHGKIMQSDDDESAGSCGAWSGEDDDDLDPGSICNDEPEDGTIDYGDDCDFDDVYDDYDDGYGCSFDDAYGYDFDDGF